MDDDATPAPGAPEPPASVLARFAEGWPRELCCGPGWWPIVERLDAELSAVDPGYRLMQVKEKFGGLRYYFELSDAVELPCCVALAATLSAAGDPAADAPSSVWDAHRASDEHRALHDARQRRYDEMYAAVQRAEAEAARTCEETGSPGVLMVRGRWLRTLDPACAPEGFEPVPVADGPAAEILSRAAASATVRRRRT